MLKGNKILVTGGTGFLGRELVKKLSQNNEVVIISRFENEMFSNAKLVVSDISEELDLENDFDYIIHLAAVVGDTKCLEDLNNSLKINVDGTEKILKFALRNNNLKKLFYASTVYVYGDSKEASNEESVLNPIGIYSEMKRKGEILVSEYCNKFKIPYVIARISNIYGNGQENIVSSIYKGISSGEIIRISDSERDFVYIKDVIMILCFLIENFEGIYNIGSGESYKIIDLASVISKTIGKPLLSNESGEAKIKKSKISIDKLKNIGIEPKYSLEEGLKECFYGY